MNFNETQVLMNQITIMEALMTLLSGKHQELLSDMSDRIATSRHLLSQHAFRPSNEDQKRIG
jgi:hypothetical protein